MIEYLEIQKLFNKVIAFSQGTDQINTDELFQEWSKNKQKFIEIFDGELIHDFGEIEVSINEEEQSYLINDFLDQAAQNMSISFYDFSEFYQFVCANKKSFFQNLVSNDSINFGKPILKGMKLSKAFKFFIKDKEELIKIQQLASKFIQQNKIKGHLCASVHPLDFLSLSENTYNWRSCHALDGEYRAGNLSYMADKVTLIWYLKGEDNVHLPNFPDDVLWNSKKWRMLCYLDEYFDYCFLGRPYPFNSKDLRNKVIDILNYYFQSFHPFINNRITKFDNTTTTGDTDLSSQNCVLYSPLIKINTRDKWEVRQLNEVVKDNSKLHYNDILYSSCYFPYYSSAIRPRNLKNEFPKITVGSKVKCLHCNSGNISFGEHSMFCPDCLESLHLSYEDYFICDFCGQRVAGDDYIITYNGDTICQECVSSGLAFFCENCGEWFVEEEGEYSEKYGRMLCKECFEEIYDEEMEYRKRNGLED